MYTTWSMSSMSTRLCKLHGSSAFLFTAEALLPAAAYTKRHCQLLYTKWSMNGILTRLCKLHGSSALPFTAEALLPAAAHTKRHCQLMYRNQSMSSMSLLKHCCLQLHTTREAVSWWTQDKLSADVHNLEQ